MGKIKFIQITTGVYTYSTYGQQQSSHAVYGLDKSGEVYKFIPSINDWKLLTDINNKENE